MPDSPRFRVGQLSGRKPVIGFDHQQAVRRCRFHQVFDAGQQISFVVDEMVVGRRAEDSPGQSGLRGRLFEKLADPEITVGGVDLHAQVRAERVDVALDDPSRGQVSLDEDGGSSPAAEGFETDGPGAGKKVDREFAFDEAADEVEQRLADVVFHRAGAEVTGVFELVSTKSAADNPNFAGPLPAGDRFPLVQIAAVFFSCHLGKMAVVLFGRRC